MAGPYDQQIDMMMFGQLVQGAADGTAQHDRQLCLQRSVSRSCSSICSEYVRPAATTIPPPRPSIPSLPYTVGQRHARVGRCEPLG
jgi:hypothetical protein